MKRNTRPKTNDYYVTEIILAILFVLSLIMLGYTLKDRSKRIMTEPTALDLIQQQEMINYARSEGRTINIY